MLKHTTSIISTARCGPAPGGVGGGARSGILTAPIQIQDLWTLSTIFVDNYVDKMWRSVSYAYICSTIIKLTKFYPYLYIFIDHNVKSISKVII